MTRLFGKSERTLKLKSGAQSRALANQTRVVESLNITTSKIRAGVRYFSVVQENSLMTYEERSAAHTLCRKATQDVMSTSILEIFRDVTATKNISDWLCVSAYRIMRLPILCLYWYIYVISEEQRSKLTATEQMSRLGLTHKTTRKTHTVNKPENRVFEADDAWKRFVQHVNKEPDVAGYGTARFVFNGRNLIFKRPHDAAVGLTAPRDNSPLQRDRDSRLFVHRPLRLVGRGERGLSGGVLHTAPLSFPGAGLCQGLKNALKLPGSELAPGSHH
ncbi:hypothetical protein E3U43_022974 [Larimichthys crocea]|uniref:Uncharacterized protein n=1 Tax=Larimichthys crocea TaxID=215358 RepID=A0ACD3R739_LARCR|nr:hypothetical protein E3U43_022974 [Larimichthys crocea]